MKTLRRVRLFAASCCGALVCFTTTLYALPESQIRKAVRQAEEFEAQSKWEEARETYELLLGQKDPGLKIRERYHNALRRCWQVRRLQDNSYRKEVLAVSYGEAMSLYKIISRTLLEGSVDKKKLDSTKLFHKGLEELDAALANRAFLNAHIPSAKHNEVAAFRQLMRTTWGDKKDLTPEEAAKQIGEVVMAAAERLNLSATVVTMEFACGACYAIDEYTVYLTPSQLRQLAQSLSRSEAIGVGLVLAVRDNKIAVQDIIPGSPADQESSININDQILSVNKKPVADLPLQMVKEMLEGQVGSMVEIELQTQGQPPRTINLQRQQASLPSVAREMIRDTSFGYLKINSFTDDTLPEVDKAIQYLVQTKNAKGLIIDLRENGGGLFDSAIDTARRFMSRGIITSTSHQNTKYNSIYQAKDPNAVSVPLVLFVDGDTASAAEVLAGALKENERAYLIGQTTFGKGCTQCVLKLPSASGIPTGGMKLTVARFFSPLGHAYSGRGVVPHFLIDERMSSSEANMMRGPYFDKAIDELTRMAMK